MVPEPAQQPQVKQHQPPEGGLVLDVVVEQPGNTCNLYALDRERSGLRLEQVISIESAQPADLARAPLEMPRNALDRFSEQMQGLRSEAGAQAPSLPVLLVTRVSIAPGVWVAARLIGAVRVKGPHTSAAEERTEGWTLVAVPRVDPEQEPIEQVAQLAEAVRDALAARALSQARPPAQPLSQFGAACVEWMEAQAAAHLVRQARATWRQQQRQQAAQAKVGGGPREHLRLGRRPAEELEQHVAWRGLTGVSREHLREQGLGAYAEAEHLLRFVPQRFQQYLGELLLDDERVLCFIERPRLRRRRGLLGLGARYLNEGLLLCTDRQVLWLRDVATPDATLVPWGYVARSCPVERLANIHLVPPGQANRELQMEASPWARLCLQNASAAGVLPLVIEFPSSALLALQQASDLLARFLPRPRGSLQALADRRVRRVPSVSVWEPHTEEREMLLQLGGMTPPEARERLQAALAEHLKPGEQVLAQAVAPALAEYRGGPRLLAITPERLLFGQIKENRRGAHQAQPTITSVPLAQVAAVQMRHSLLGCTFEALVPQADGQLQRHLVPFNSPAIVPFRAIYTRARLLIAGPFQGLQQSDQTDLKAPQSGGTTP